MTTVPWSLFLEESVPSKQRFDALSETWVVLIGERMASM